MRLRSWGSIGISLNWLLLLLLSVLSSVFVVDGVTVLLWRRYCCRRMLLTHVDLIGDLPHLSIAICVVIRDTCPADVLMEYKVVDQVAS
jgi:hypothetical protein